MAKMNTSNVGKVNFGTNPPRSGAGTGVNKRDSTKATGTPMGGPTKKLTNGQVTRSSGSFAGYRNKGNGQ